MPEYAYVYILASSFKHLYIGFTTNLEQRVWQHKNQTFPDSFTARYRIDHLVYFERYSLITRGIAREKELKGWRRSKKIALIVANNRHLYRLHIQRTGPTKSTSRHRVAGEHWRNRTLRLGWVNG